jgi:type II secretory pathway component PulF
MADTVASDSWDRTVTAARVRALVAAVAFFALTMVTLLTLVWRYVPARAMMFERLGVPLPLLTRVVIVESQWVPRLLPQLVVLCGVILAIIARISLAGGIRARSRRRVVNEAIVLTGALALLGVFACAVVVYSMRPSLERSVVHP